MAELKKNQDQEELFRTIYKIATDLVHAGHVAEWDFKSYVLGTMFYRYISENFTEYVNKGEWDAGNPDFDYTKMRRWSVFSRTSKPVLLPVLQKTTLQACLKILM